MEKEEILLKHCTSWYVTNKTTKIKIFSAMQEWAEEYHRRQPPIVSYAEQAAKEIGAMTDEEFANLHKPCDHPWDSVIGGEMKPEKCLKCGEYL